MDLQFRSYNSAQTKEFNYWHTKEREEGFYGLDRYVVLQDCLLGDYLEFVDGQIDDIFVESVYLKEKLVGFIGYSMQNDSHLHVEILGVNPDFRGKGIAGEMLKAFKAKMQQSQNIDRFTLSVKKDNESGIASFAKVGTRIKKDKEESYIDFEL